MIDWKETARHYWKQGRATSIWWQDALSKRTDDALVTTNALAAENARLTVRVRELEISLAELQGEITDALEELPRASYGDNETNLERWLAYLADDLRAEPPQDGAREACGRW
jgi:hypothetical protein